MIELENNYLRMQIDPNMGACILALQAGMSDGSWQDIMRPAPAGALSPNTSSYILAPYSNRIRDGRFEFAGQIHQLKANWFDGQVIHGDVHPRAWRVVHQDKTALRCVYNSRENPDANFPFQFQCLAGFELKDNALILDLQLTNTDSVSMPAGFGHHPYFTRFIGGADAKIKFAVANIYKAEDALNPIPVAAAVAIGPEHDFKKSRAIGESKIDAVFNGWDGKFEMVWPELTLKISADEIFSHLVVYTAPDNTLAVEPVSHATDGFNLVNKGIENLGVKILQPLESMRGQVIITTVLNTEEVKP